MFSHWSRPQLDLATHAVQEVVHRKQNLSTRGCVILYTFRRKLVNNLLCLCKSCVHVLFWRYYSNMNVCQFDLLLTHYVITLVYKRIIGLDIN